MAKRNKHKWHKRIYCKKCKGYRTIGGMKFKLFGFIPIKFTIFKHECRCFEYKGETELDKEKCKEVLSDFNRFDKITKIEKENKNND